MCGVGGSLEQVASERDDERAVKSDADALQHVQVGVGSTTLDATRDHAADAGPIGQCRARPAATFTHRPDLTSEPDPLLKRAAGGLDGQ